MTDSEMLRQILTEVQGVHEDVRELRQDVDVLKGEMKELRQDVDILKGEMKELCQDVEDLERKVAGIRVHLENGTDKNVQLIAENFIELTKKLNQAIPVADNNLAYEVKVNYLLERVQHLEKAIEEIKSKIA